MKGIKEKRLPICILLLVDSMKRINERPISRTEIVKHLFLLEKEFDVPSTYNFKLFLYGPYDPQILIDLEYSEQVGLLEEKEIKTRRGYIAYIYFLTGKGQGIINIERGDLQRKIDKEVTQNGRKSVEELEEYILKKFFFTSEDERENLRSRNYKIKKVLEGAYKKTNFDEELFDYLVMVDYARYILNNLTRIQKDYNRKIILSECKNLLNYLEDSIKSNIKDYGLKSDLNEIFNCLNIFARRYGLHSLFEKGVDVTEFLNDGEKKWLMKNTSPLTA